jgi:tripartite-type tricarboxylate transporter receptor subunit TctC
MKKELLFMAASGALVVVLSVAGLAPAVEIFPSKSINYIVPLEPGSGGDIGARAIVAKAKSFMDQPIVVVNKPGGGSTIGYREIYSAQPNGYTIGLGTATLVTNKLQGLLPYDYRDFSIMGSYASWVGVVVVSRKTNRPFKNFEELVKFSKAKPGEVSIASSGVGQFWWIAAMALEEKLGVQWNFIPQAGSGGFTIIQLAGGHADLTVVDLAAAISQIEAGNVLPVAVFGERRLPGKYGTIQTLKELGYEVDLVSTHVVIGPPKMPQDITTKVSQVFEKAANDPEFQNFLLERNATPGWMTPEQTMMHLDKQRSINRSVMEKTGILKEK